MLSARTFFLDGSQVPALQTRPFHSGEGPKPLMHSTPLTKLISELSPAPFHPLAVDIRLSSSFSPACLVRRSFLLLLSPFHHSPPSFFPALDPHFSFFPSLTSHAPFCAQPKSSSLAWDHYSIPRSQTSQIPKSNPTSLSATSP